MLRPIARLLLEPVHRHKETVKTENQAAQPRGANHLERRRPKHRFPNLHGDRLQLELSSQSTLRVVRVSSGRISSYQTGLLCFSCNGDLTPRRNGCVYCKLVDLCSFVFEEREPTRSKSTVAYDWWWAVGRMGL
jgi:hypothetical protein